MILMTPQVAEYLNSQFGNGNSAFCPHVKDSSNRFLLPMDQVAAGFFTDEKVEILISGVVEDTDDFNQRVFIKPHTDKLEPFWVECGNTIKIPSHSLGLTEELMLYFSSINGMILSSKQLHINGQPLSL